MHSLNGCHGRCQVSSYTSEDDANLEFKVEYTGKSSAPKTDAVTTPSSPDSGSESKGDGEGAAAGPLLGRRVVVPVHLRFRPSLQV